jgi:4'-phosphopantetheinyl transferase EntD
MIDFQANINQHIFQYFTSNFEHDNILTTDESRQISTAGKKRTRDFIAGRYCAKKCLKAMGYSSTEVLIGENGQPKWPTDCVGSLSHSNYLAGAITASSKEFLSLGIDIEQIGKITKDMWEMIFVDSEKEYLLNLPSEEDLDLFSTILFSFKESFYKFQYPVTGLVLDFKDVEFKKKEANFIVNSVNNERFNLFHNETINLEWFIVENQVITICYQKR